MTVQLSFLLLSEEGLDIRHLWQILEWHFFLLKDEKPIFEKCTMG